MDFQSFRIAVDNGVLEDLRRRLRQTRWPDQIPGAGWKYGTDLEYVRDLCLYWEAKYDWRASEAALNAWPQIHHPPSTGSESTSSTPGHRTRTPARSCCCMAGPVRRWSSVRYSGRSPTQQPTAATPATPST